LISFCEAEQTPAERYKFQVQEKDSCYAAELLAVENAGQLRDALGAKRQSGLPQACI